MSPWTPWAVAGFAMAAVVALFTAAALSYRRLAREARRSRDHAAHLDDEMRRRQAEVDDARHALARVERMAALGQLAAGVGHEINNPLTYVVGNLRFARGRLAELGIDDAELRAVLREAEDGAERIRGIVRDLKVLSPGAPERRGETDVEATLRAALKLVRHDLKHRATLVERLGETPAVRGEPRRLTQVFVNLLINAAQSLPEDALPSEHRIEVRAFTDDQGHAVVEVEDTGEGIAPEHLARVFEPYFSTKSQSDGTGLGLSICRGIVEAMGGELGLASAVGVGTTFRVRIPPMPGGRHVVASGFAGARPTPTSSAAHPRRARILVVDDDALVARSLRRNLHGHEVGLAANGEEAWQILGGDPDWDVVLCDVMMPGVDGVELFDRVRRERPMLAQRFVFITGGAVSERSRRFLDALEEPWLTKPIDPDELEAQVTEAIRRRDAERRVGAAVPGA